MLKNQTGNSKIYNQQNPKIQVTLNNSCKNKTNPPKRSLLEEIGNSITHGLGSIFSIVAFVLMLSTANTSMEVVGAIVYFVGLFVLFTEVDQLYIPFFDIY